MHKTIVVYLITIQIFVFQVDTGSGVSIMNLRQFLEVWKKSLEPAHVKHLNGVKSSISW